MHRALSGATTPGQSGPGNNDNEGVLRIPPNWKKTFSLLHIMKLIDSHLCVLSLIIYIYIYIYVCVCVCVCVCVWERERERERQRETETETEYMWRVFNKSFRKNFEIKSRFQFWHGTIGTRLSIQNTRWQLAGPTFRLIYNYKYNL